MRVEKRDGSLERRVLIGMVVDPAVLARVASHWEDGLFSSPWGNRVGGWCVDYFKRYGKAPDKAIQVIYESWAAHAGDKDTVKLVEKFLGELSGEYTRLAKESNSELLIDLAAKHFNKVRAYRLTEEVQGFLETGEVEKALKHITDWNKVEMGVGAGVDVLSDKQAIKQAFASKSDPLVKYPGAAGNFFADALERDAFISFEGHEKKGKSWWLLDLAWRAMLQGRKVAFFEVGDMSQNQIMRRFMTRAARRPFKAETIKVPTFIEPAEPYCEVTHTEEVYEDILHPRTAWRACRKILVRTGNKQSLLRLSCHPNSTLSVHGILAILDSWDRTGWQPDVIVIDYSDILAPISKSIETRDQINLTWKSLRALSQSHHCLVVTATQADAASYRAETLDMTNFTDDKRKRAHVTGSVGLNATREEKEMGITRLNWIVLRESQSIIEKCCCCCGCLALANPCMLSTF